MTQKVLDHLFKKICASRIASHKLDYSQQGQAKKTEKQWCEETVEMPYNP